MPIPGSRSTRNPVPGVPRLAIHRQRPSRAECTKMPITRRELLTTGSLAFGALALGDAYVRTGESKRVVIIGAGLAGLSAGFELQKSGHEITILEARDRAGGRVLTLREPFSD